MSTDTSVPPEILNRQVFAAIEAALSGTEDPGPFDESTWPDLFMEVVRPLLRNMRDVRRYAAAIQGSVSDLDGQIALADLLALEAVRVFLPDVFSRLHFSVEGLTTTSGVFHGARDDPPYLKTQVEDLMRAGGSRSEVVRSLIERLFPAALRHVGGSQFGADWKGQWLRERRVAHQDVLRLYLERVAGESLQAFTDAERAWPLMKDRDAFDAYLRSLPIDRLEDVIGALEIYEDQFTGEQVVPGSIVLLNLLPDLPERHRGMFDVDTRLVVGRVVYRLLRAVDDPSALTQMVSAILPELTTLSSKSELITDVGHREGAGHKLVSEGDAKALEASWREQVRSAEVEDLVKEPDLLRTLFLAKRYAEPEEPALVISQSPEMTRALLKAARSEARSQAVGSRAVIRSPRLAWDVLLEVYGDDATLRQRIEDLRAAALDGSDELLSLADRYLSGWRPD